MRALVMEELKKPLVIRNMPDPECADDLASRLGEVTAGTRLFLVQIST